MATKSIVKKVHSIYRKENNNHYKFVLQHLHSSEIIKLLRASNATDQDIIEACAYSRLIRNHCDTTMCIQLIDYFCTLEEFFINNPGQVFDWHDKFNELSLINDSLAAAFLIQCINIRCYEKARHKYPYDEMSRISECKRIRKEFLATYLT